jgi:hypothetical protein
LSTYDVAAGAGEAAYVYSVNDQPIHRVQGSEVSTVAGPVNSGGWQRCRPTGRSPA